MKWIFKRLLELGHFYCDEALKHGLVETVENLSWQDAVVKAAIESWQKWNVPRLDALCDAIHDRPLKIDGEVGPATIYSLNMPRCGHPDYEHPDSRQRTGQWNWPVLCRDAIPISHRLLNLRGVTPDETHACVIEAGGNWANVALLGFDMQQENYPNTGIFLREAWLSRGTLADQYLANGSCRSNLEGRYNLSVNWYNAQLVACMSHELGHALGLRHLNDPSTLMYGVLTDKSIASRGRPTEFDIQHLEASGYVRRPDEPEPPEPPVGEGNLVLENNVVTYVPTGETIDLEVAESG